MREIYVCKILQALVKWHFPCKYGVESEIMDLRFIHWMCNVLIRGKKGK